MSAIGRVRSAWTPAIILILVLTPIARTPCEEPRPGTVQWSNGEAVTGAIAPVPGTTLQFHDGRTLLNLDFTRLRELRLVPEKETLERQFRMPEAGKAFREESGAPYPLRQFKVQVVFTSGETASGHLYTAAFTVDPGGSDDPAAPPVPRRKVILPAKQQGRPGDAFATLVYPSRISFSDAGAAPAQPLAVRVADPAVEEFAAVTRDGLALLESTRTMPGRFAIASGLGAELFLATRAGTRITVGWPAGDAALTARMTTALADAADFFDDRKLLGAWRQEGSLDLFTLVLLWRRSAVTGAPGHPWQVGLMRWHLESDEAGARVMLAGRGEVFRGLAETAADLPQVTCSAALWQPPIVGGELVVDK